MVIPIDHFPLTHHGKIDRNALPKPDSAAARVHLPAQTPCEIQIAQIFSEILGVTSIGRNDSFFDLGGDSILAVRVTNRLRERFNIPLPLSLLFDTPLVAEIAVGIEKLLILRESSAAHKKDSPPVPSATPVRKAKRRLSRVTMSGDEESHIEASNGETK